MYGGFEVPTSMTNKRKGNSQAYVLELRGPKQWGKPCTLVNDNGRPQNLLRATRTTVVVWTSKGRKKGAYNLSSRTFLQQVPKLGNCIRCPIETEFVLLPIEDPPFQKTEAFQVSSGLKDYKVALLNDRTNVLVPQKQDVMKLFFVDGKLPAYKPIFSLLPTKLEHSRQ